MSDTTPPNIVIYQPTDAEGVPMEVSVELGNVTINGVPPITNVMGYCKGELGHWSGALWVCEDPTCPVHAPRAGEQNGAAPQDNQASSASEGADENAPSSGSLPNTSGPAAAAPPDVGEMVKSLHEDMDASRWAREFIKIFAGLHEGCELDEGWIIGWFANAIMCGYDEANRRSQSQSQPKPEPGGEVANDNLAEVGQVLEMCRSILRDIIRRAPGVRTFVDDEAFIMNEINPALVKLHKVAELLSSQNVGAEKVVRELAEAVYGNWISDRDDDGLYGCDYCAVRFDMDKTIWPDVIHDSDCIVVKAAMLAKDRT